MINPKLAQCVCLLFLATFRHRSVAYSVEGMVGKNVDATNSATVQAFVSHKCASQFVSNVRFRATVFANLQVKRSCADLRLLALLLVCLWRG